ncbi:MAG: CAP domain-containing protein [Pirellulales bacterium]|nr:CAP domain-containing protein [Pirellulales bacterium]
MVTRVIVCALVFLSATVVCAKESTTPHGVEPKDVVKAKWELLPIEKNIVKYTNQQRKRYGLHPLKIDRQLVGSAREHAQWMTRNRTLQHTRRAVAENIAMGYSSSESVVRGWMNSSGHRANILNGGYTRIGVAAYRTPNGTIYWCQQFRR